MPDSDTSVLTTKDVALQLKISERTLWSLTNSGAIIAVKIGRLVRYSRQDVHEFIQRSRTGGAPSLTAGLQNACTSTERKN